MMRILVVTLALLSLGGTATAQTPVAVPQDSAERRAHVAPVILGAVAGSALGVTAGFAFGSRLGWGGGDDPGLAGALLFSVVGSAVGTAAGIHLTTSGRIPPGQTWSLSVASILGGIAGAALLSSITGGEWDETGVFIGYALGQGITAGALASRMQRK